MHRVRDSNENNNTVLPRKKAQAILAINSIDLMPYSAPSISSQRLFCVTLKDFVQPC